MIGHRGRRLFALSLLVLLLLMLTLAATAGLSGHRFVIGSGGGPLSQDGLVLQSSFGLPVVGGARSELTLCSGFQAQACFTGGYIYLPLIVRADG